MDYIVAAIITGHYMSNEQLRNTLVGLLIISSVACLFYLSYVITTQEPVIASYRMDLNAEFDDVAGFTEPILLEYRCACWASW